ncbi:PREDICTED: flocculation protein FLO11-like [Priapulus caudatus]|uniref:Flocculation protein FLO11-like n=1 Tax=Priapulus caudatus TaxID=37621 RepID=A0ABM1FBT5_PRICU|nr:PREDICTED: flocculation protein FLO11-like [Priapulus caudatus]
MTSRILPLVTTLVICTVLSTVHGRLTVTAVHKDIHVVTTTVNLWTFFGNDSTICGAWSNNQECNATTAGAHPQDGVATTTGPLESDLRDVSNSRNSTGKIISNVTSAAMQPVGNSGTTTTTTANVQSRDNGNTTATVPIENVDSVDNSNTMVVTTQKLLTTDSGSTTIAPSAQLQSDRNVGSITNTSDEVRPTTVHSQMAQTTKGDISTQLSHTASRGQHENVEDDVIHLRPSETSTEPVSYLRVSAQKTTPTVPTTSYTSAYTSPVTTSTRDTDTSEPSSKPVIESPQNGDILSTRLPQQTEVIINTVQPTQTDGSSGPHLPPQTDDITSTLASTKIGGVADAVISTDGSSVQTTLRQKEARESGIPVSSVSSELAMESMPSQDTTPDTTRPRVRGEGIRDTVNLQLEEGATGAVLLPFSKLTRGASYSVRAVSIGAAITVLALVALGATFAMLLWYRRTHSRRYHPQHYHDDIKLVEISSVGSISSRSIVTVGTRKSQC